MSSIASTSSAATAGSTTPAAPRRRGPDRWQFWGRALVLPYLLVFLVFVLYPVGYGLWLARHPSSYVHLVEDPIFFRSVVNSLVFLIVAINIKMVIAMILSGFFVQVGAFSTQENAEKQRGAVRSYGNPEISQGSAGGRDVYRVRLGPYTTSDAAGIVADRLKRSGYGDARVVAE